MQPIRHHEDATLKLWSFRALLVAPTEPKKGHRRQVARAVVSCRSRSLSNGARRLTVKERGITINRMCKSRTEGRATRAAAASLERAASACGGTFCDCGPASMP